MPKQVVEMERWIPIGERLPAWPEWDSDDRIVALNSNGYSACVTYIWDSGDARGWVGEDSTPEETTYPISGITHWMPLPPAPTVSPQEKK